MKTKSKNLWIILATALVLCAAAAVAWGFNAPKRTFEKNLKAVASYVFVMPDKYLNDVAKAIDENGTFPEELDLPDATTGIDENVQQYFTAEAYEKFKSGWYTFSGFCVGTDYTTHVKDFKTEDYSGGQTKFTATLSYGKPNEETVELVVWGRARSDSEGKIEFWSLMKDPNSALIKPQK